MNKKLIFFLMLLFFFVKSNYSQEINSKKHINKIHKVYEQKLILNKKQSKKIKEILWKYNSKIKDLIDSEATKIKINQLTKEETLEIYNILSREQFTEYKKLKKDIEEYKRYRK
jgi:hypothetical protein